MSTSPGQDIIRSENDSGRGAPAPSPNALPDRLPMPRHLDPIAALAYRTPIQEHLVSADGKAAGILTLLGIMFTVLARCADTLSTMLQARGAMRAVVLAVLVGFAVTALGAVVQAFRTISPRFPRAKFSLAFFGDISRLSRDEYVRQVEALTPLGAIEHMLTFNHTAASICVSKMQQLRKGFRWFEAAFLLWLPLVTLLAIKALTK